MPRAKKSTRKTATGARKTGTSEFPPLPGSREDRRAKLDMYLKDFDVQVESRIREMKKQHKSLISKFDSDWRLYKMKIPPEVMSMTLDRFIHEFDGDVSVYHQKMAASPDESIDNLVDNLLDADLEPKRPSPSNSTSSLGRSDEENAEGAPAASLPRLLGTPPLPGFDAATPAATGTQRRPLADFPPANVRPPRLSEENRPLSKPVLVHESQKGSPLVQSLDEMSSPELQRVISRIYKSRLEKKERGQSVTDSKGREKVDAVVGS